MPIVAIRFAFEGGSDAGPGGQGGSCRTDDRPVRRGRRRPRQRCLPGQARRCRRRDALRRRPRRRSTARCACWPSSKDEAFDLLRLAIEQPRFDAAPIDRIRAQIVSGIVASARDPETEAGGKWREALYGDHPYARPDEGTENRWRPITADDLHAFHKAIFARGNLHVGVVGAIDAETLKRELDKLFGDLPEKPTEAGGRRRLPKLGQEVASTTTCRRPRCSSPFRASSATRPTSSPPI